MIATGRSLVLVYLLFVAGLGSADLGMYIINNILYFLSEGFGVSSGRVIYRLDRFEPHTWVEPIVCEEGRYSSSFRLNRVRGKLG